LGFLEYAWALFFDKDWLKNKILISPEATFPRFYKKADHFVYVLPEPKEIKDEEEKLSFLGYIFPADVMGQRQLASLFRASVFYLSALSLIENFDDYRDWMKGKNKRLATFISFVIEGVKAITYISLNYPDKLLDLALANTLAIRRLRKIDGYINPATKIMTGLMFKSHTGLNPIKSSPEKEAIDELDDLIQTFRGKYIEALLEETTDVKAEKLNVASKIYDKIEESGVITETPFLPHTPEIGLCSIFHSSLAVNFDVMADQNFTQCLKFLGATPQAFMGTDQTWRKVAENEALQVVDDWKRQKEKDCKVLLKYQNLLSFTRFKGVHVPDLDYTEFLRIKSRCKSEAHRLIESLLAARDMLDEDSRKLYGILDLQDVIQVVAARSNRTDVFLLDENISKSYSWVIMLDASESMKAISDFAMEIFVILAEVANELLLDPTSWALYAFNDRFFVIKDMKERYNMRVKSRIGGVKFSGLSYIPDALTLAGEVMKTRNDELRLITIISDGWPYGYQNITTALTETVNTLKSREIVSVGIGAKSTRMGIYFPSSCSIFTLRDLTKQFSSIFLEESQIAAET